VWPPPVGVPHQNDSGSSRMAVSLVQPGKRRQRRDTHGKQSPHSTAPMASICSRLMMNADSTSAAPCSFFI